MDFDNTIKTLEEKGFEFVKSYFNGEEGYWGFNKERDVEVILKIIEIPEDVDWEVDEYDGLETIHEKHRSWSE